MPGGCCHDDHRIDWCRAHRQSDRTACVANGYDVVISNSRGPETLAELVAELGPKARAATAAEAATPATSSSSPYP